MSDAGVQSQAAFTVAAPRVSVVGHRTFRVAGPDLVEQAVHSGLAMIAASWADVVANPHRLFARDTTAPSLLCGMAEGVDIWAAEWAKKALWPLRAVLPEAWDGYASQFEDVSGTLRKEWKHRGWDAIKDGVDSKVFVLDAHEDWAGSSLPGWVQYDAVARALLDQSDVMLAVLEAEPRWRIAADGRGPAVFAPGSTHDVVRRARKRGVPLLLGIVDGIGVQWRVYAPGADTAAVGMFDVRVGLADILARLAEPQDLPSDPGSHDAGPGNRSECLAYLSATKKEGEPVSAERNRPSGLRLRTSKWSQGWLSRSYPRPSDQDADEGRGRQQARALRVSVDQRGDPSGHELPAHLQRLRNALNQANGLAVWHMDRYRGSFLLLYGLGALAVAFGVAAQIWNPHLYWGEVFCVGSAGVIYALSQRSRDKERAVSYRILAEELRHAEALHFLGADLPYSRLPAFDPHARPGPTWTSWLARVVVRGTPIAEAGLGGGPLIVTFRGRWPDLIRHSWEWVQGQVVYQRRTGHRYQRRKHRLERIVLGAYAVVVAALVGHFFWHLPVFSALTMVLPAVVGAVHGVMVQAEMERLGRRALALEKHLIQARDQLFAAWQDSLLSKTFPPPQASSPMQIFDSQETPIAPWTWLHRWATDTGRLMLEELYDWRGIYLSHELPL